jgi:hypothetical protein
MLLCLPLILRCHRLLVRWLAKGVVEFSVNQSGKKFSICFSNSGHSPAELNGIK